MLYWPTNEWVDWRWEQKKSIEALDKIIFNFIPETHAHLHKHKRIIQWDERKYIYNFFMEQNFRHLRKMHMNPFAIAFRTKNREREWDGKFMYEK
jgi:hypothetical protein